MTDVFIKRKEELYTDEGRTPHSYIGRAWSDAAARQGMPGIEDHHQMLGRSKEGF